MPDVPTRERQTTSLGSGVIIDAKNGYVVTNQHVIQNSNKINVRLHDGRSFDAKLIGADSEADIAADAPANPDPIIKISVFKLFIYLNSNLISQLFI